MNRMTRGFGLLLLAMATACVAEVEPPSGEELAGDEVPGVSSVAGSFAPKPQGGGPAPGRERTTVDLPWIVPGYPMTQVTATDPATVPEKYATNLRIRLPHVVKSGPGAPYVDPTLPRSERATCSGTLVGSTAVLTAGHCVINWEEIGKDATTGAPVYAKVRSYSIDARVRRNGGGSIAAGAPHGAQAVKKSFWRFSNWPSSSHDFYDQDHDFAVVRLKSPPTPAVPPAGLRSISSPQGVFIEAAHYPFASRRFHRMYNSVGDIDALDSTTLPNGTLYFFLNVYRHRMGIEPGSSGAGVFEFGVDGVAGVVTSETRSASVRSPGQTRTGFPNRALMFTPSIQAQIAAWIIAPI